ncbi:class I SAM-dependent methyltransferase [Paraburkholderia sp. Ac-20336]|uniref:class I SAM-dependent methyltransferase n=1 Tax=Burkholderiaceae TaxID=119060 RepID=UPI00141DBA88|nr:MULTISPECIES: class I SAM-dependent methyltransferase [Burkholderiaceae]MBN3805127.1 class I SAM-dependent methyltransferase [Paraburkholderia sp. Ac-20336]NIF52060.1 class I SAM-dependent methyltransferase [Burkholderia sp. Ax-1724]
MSINVSGTEGYAERAPALREQWRAISFAGQHGPILHFMPDAPAKIVDIGCGIGTDAAALAALGHAVVAIEPVDELREAARELHPSAPVEWLDDSLPDLAVLLARRGTFDAVMLTAVWMHLDEEQRHRAMPRIASLLRAGGVSIMSLRHGPVPEGRRMFDVTPEETIRLASMQGLRLVCELQTSSVQQANRDHGVTWTRLVFEKSVPPGWP